MIFNRSNVLVLALGLLAVVLSPRPADAALKRAGGRKTRSEDPAERRRLLEEREEAFAAANPYSVVADQEHRRAHSGTGSGHGSGGHHGFFYFPYSDHSGKGKGKGSGGCGYPDERCCSDPSHRCVPGYGCKFPADFMDPREDDYTCVKCGATDGPCCNIGCGEDSCESTCLPGNTCNLFQNKCEACGGDGQPCCPDDVCSAGSTCNPILKECETCGAQVGDPCCSGDSGDFCSNDNLACDEDTATCQNCGGDDQLCCPGDVCNLDTQACNTGTGKCEDCGNQAGAICCSGAICPFNATFPPDDSGLLCNANDNRCQECGQPGQICCPLGEYEVQCKDDQLCLDSGICEDLGDPDLQPDGCLLSNGNQDSVAAVPGDRGCNRYTIAAGPDFSGTARTDNNAICCKGCCTQQQGKNADASNGDGSTFMWCAGNKNGDGSCPTDTD